MVESNIMSILIHVYMLVLLAAIAITDIKEKVIKINLLIILLLGSAAEVYVSNELNIIGSFAAMAVIFSLLSLIYYFSKKSIGWGDVLLCSFIAPYLGIERALTMLFISILCCGLYAMVLVFINKESRKKEIPFAPFAVMGTLGVLML